MMTDEPPSRSCSWRTLVFDDDDAVRALLARLLRRRGHEVETFAYASPCGACRCDERSRCADIIISDIAMPGVDGIEFVSHQRQVGCRVGHLALMSGRWTRETWELAQELTIQPFQKPLDLDALQFWLAMCEGKGEPDRILAPWYPQDDVDGQANDGPVG